MSITRWSWLLVVFALCASCADAQGGPAGSVPLPASTPAVSNANQLSASDCVAGIKPFGQGASEPIKVDCTSPAADAQVLAIVRDAGTKCPSETNRYLSVPTGPPTDQFHILCLKLLTK